MVSSKYVVLTQINENRGQGGRWGYLYIAFCLFVSSSDLQPISRAGIACHWEDNDVVAQEVYYNVRMNLINVTAS